MISALALAACTPPGARAPSEVSPASAQQYNPRRSRVRACQRRRRAEFLMSVLRMIYLALAVWGAIHPMYYFIQWFQENGWAIMAMVDAWHVNAATSGLVWDLTIAAVALTVWIIAEVATRRNWGALIAIPATFCIGVSCGLPLYLFLRLAPVR